MPVAAVASMPLNLPITFEGLPLIDPSLSDNSENFPNYGKIEIDRNGETALCRAVVRNQIHLVKLLLDRGACRFIKGFRGDALDIAKDRSNAKIIALLKNYTEIQAEEEEKSQRSLIFRLFINEQNKRGEVI